MATLQAKFKVGDRVRCIEDLYRQDVLKTGEIYIINSLQFDGLRVTLKGHPFGQLYRPDRFEHAYIKEFAEKLSNLIKEE